MLSCRSGGLFVIAFLLSAVHEYAFRLVNRPSNVLRKNRIKTCSHSKSPLMVMDFASLSNKVNQELLEFEKAFLSSVPSNSVSVKESYFRFPDLPSTSTSVFDPILSKFSDLFNSIVKVSVSHGTSSISSDIGIYDVLEATFSPAIVAIQIFLSRLGFLDDQSREAAILLLVVGSGAFITLTFASLYLLTVDRKKIEIPTTFDLEALDAFYMSKPVTLVSRLIYVSYKIAIFALSLWVDSATGKWETNMPKRAIEVSTLLQKTGPAYIKLGQGVSIRPDILPEAYLLELQKLQDQVPPFSNEEAKRIIQRELGCKLEDVFVDIDDFSKPIAAASLGQVYRARLKQDGTTVAVKVQRPKVLEAVTIDLYVTRIILLALSAVPSIRDSTLAFLAVIDNWGVRFLDELDYLQEAKNGDRFRKEMSYSKELGEAILVPKVYTEYTSRYLLISEWIEGERVSNIDVTAPGGRERLEKIIATLLNAYLTQLLESGFLHADPHPGNFLCTPDGRLCILDYGLMTEVTEEQRYALLEYVSHLTAKDYEATLGDLIVLGFIPREIGDDPDKAALVAPLLGHVLEQLSGGGGAKAITVETVGEEIEELGKQYPIVIPSYFGLIIRAFSALEGLGLQLNPQYSIVNECFPYLARRLLTENTPRMQRMLRTFLYGRNGNVLRVDRVDEIVAGYSAFTALADEASNGLGMGKALPLRQALGESSGESFVGRTEGMERVSMASAKPSEKRKVDLLADPVARDALKLLFSKDGNYVQDLVVEELVRMTDALGRNANLQLLQSLRTFSEASRSPLSLLRVLSTARLNPILAPLQLLSKLQLVAFDRVTSRLEVALELTADDQEALNTLQRLIEIFRNANGSTARAEAVRSQFGYSRGGSLSPRRIIDEVTSGGAKEVIEAARSLAGVFTLVAPGARAMTERYLTQLLSRALRRLAENIEDVPGRSLIYGQTTQPASAISKVSENR